MPPVTHCLGHVSCDPGMCLGHVVHVAALTWALVYRGVGEGCGRQGPGGHPNAGSSKSRWVHYPSFASR